MFQVYKEKNFTAASLEIIAKANVIIKEYQQQGFTLTLRQLYYQFVARDLLPNTLRSYNRLGSIVNDARMAGRISWEAIEDRTRNLQTLGFWDSPRSIMEAVAQQYRIDKWEDQPRRVEVWIEKEALVGVIASVCNQLQVPFFACRGYNSQSEQWAAGRRFGEYIERGQSPLVLHLGDHDPSGIDMTRDNAERLTMFAESPVEVQRLALNFDQIELYRPPPNPAKMTDSRFAGYQRLYGDQSWELDALEPSLIANLIRDAVCSVRDESIWEASLAREDEGRNALYAAMEALE